MSSLEDKLNALLELQGDLSRDEIARQATTIILHHAPKTFEGWPALLRRLADYIESLPEPIMLSGKELSVFIDLAERGMLKKATATKP